MNQEQWLYRNDGKNTVVTDCMVINRRRYSGNQPGGCDWRCEPVRTGFPLFDQLKLWIWWYCRTGPHVIFVLKKKNCPDRLLPHL